MEVTGEHMGAPEHGPQAVSKPLLSKGGKSRPTGFCDTPLCAWLGFINSFSQASPTSTMLRPLPLDLFLLKVLKTWSVLGCFLLQNFVTRQLQLLPGLPIPRYGDGSQV